MTLGQNNADDSCLKNQTVGSPGFSSSAAPACIEKNLPENGGSESDPDQPATGVNTVEEDCDFPEGGLKAWLVVFGSFCAMLSVYGTINTAAVFESYFSTNQLKDYSHSEIGWIFSIYLFLVFFLGVQIGPIFDKYGPRWVVAIGTVLVSTSQILLGFCEGYYQILLVYAVLGGIGGALLNPTAYGCIAHYFHKRRGFATGIAATAGSVGGIIFPVLLQNLIPRLGFSWSTRILGFIILGLSIPANTFLQSRLPPSDRLVSVWPDWSIFRDAKLTLCCAGIWFMEWGIFVPLTYIVSYAVYQGNDATTSYALLAILNAGSFPGRFLPGLIADRIGRFNVICMTIFLCALTILSIWLPSGSSKPVLIAFAILFGFASGSNLGLSPVCIGQLCNSRDYGRYYSTAMMVASFGTLTSLPIAGALLGLGTPEQGWTALILFAAMSYLMAMACFFAARVLAVGWGFKKVF